MACAPGIAASGFGDEGERGGGAEDGNSLVAAERVQIGIAADDRLGPGGKRTSKHCCIVGVAQPRLFDRKGFDGLGDFPVARENLAGREVRLPELLRELGPVEDASKLCQERFGGTEFEHAFAGEFDQPLRVRRPTEGRRR